MPDVFSKIKRSQIMSKIKSKNTKLEIKFKKLIRGLRFRYQPKIFGKPDFAHKKLKIVVFIDSCFWHKCPKHFRKPKANALYWIKKANSNVKRAQEVNNNLKRQGWGVIRLWEHDIDKAQKISLLKTKKLISLKNSIP